MSGLTRADVEAARGSLDALAIINKTFREADPLRMTHIPGEILTRMLAHIAEADAAARQAVETWDEIGQAGEPFVERLRASLLPEQAR